MPNNAVGEHFSHSINSGIEKVWTRGWGECQEFPSKFSCITVPKNFIGQPLRVSLNSGIEKLYASEGYVTISVEVFLSDNAEKFCRGTLLCCVPENFRQRKNLWIRGRGKCPESPPKTSCLTVSKKFVGQLFRVSLISGIEKFYNSEGYVTIFVNFFVSEHRKI